MSVARPHPSQDERYQEVFARIPEGSRSHVVTFGTDAESYWGVKINGRPVDLRQRSVAFSAYDKSAFGKPIKTASLKSLAPLVDLEGLDFEDFILSDQKALLELPRLRHLELHNVSNFEGHIPQSLETLTLRFSSASSYRIRQPEAALNLRHLNYYGSSVSDLSAEARLPNLQSIELYGTPIHTHVKGAFNLGARIDRAIKGDIILGSRRMAEQVEELEGKGVDVSFVYDPPY